MPRSSASRQYSPQELLFTDRVDESDVLRQALISHREFMDTVDDVPAAKNILVYYGVGGIGKTTLSERLEAWVQGQLAPTDMWGHKPSVTVDATCRIDLHRSQGRVDMVDAVVAIRMAFGKIRKRWPAFDLAFAAYWSATHPNQPLPGAGTADSSFADGAAETITEVLSESGIPFAGTLTRTIRTIARDFHTRKRRHNAFAAYDGFEDLLHRCSEVPAPDDPHFEILGDIAALLNTDLCNWETDSAPLVIVFIDTFERLTDDSRRADEATVNQLVWRMPNVLFVVTGRQMLDWYDETRTNLYVVGRSVWPGLCPSAAEEPRQHIVGDLAFEDRLRIIRRGRELYRIEIDDTVMRELATASHGLPQYLKLALELAVTRKLNGDRPINVADVTGSLRDLVIRVLEDVPADEQRALRAAALLPFFSVQVVAKAAGVDQGCALRAMARPMIDDRGSKAFPYTMHDAIRAAIRSSPHDVPNGWSAGDWGVAGELGLQAIECLYNTADNANDIPMLLETLGLAISLVSDQQLRIGPASSTTYADWITQAIVFGPSISALRPGLPAKANTDMGRGIIDFVVAKTTEVTTDEAVELLGNLFESSHPLAAISGST